jgi:hypothetical protein
MRKLLETKVVSKVGAQSPPSTGANRRRRSLDFYELNSMSEVAKNGEWLLMAKVANNWPK